MSKFSVFWLALLLMVSSKLSALEHSYKLFATLGSGHAPVIVAGGGFTYALYGYQESRKLLHTFDVNLYLLEIHDSEHKKFFGLFNPEFQVNFFVGYGLGFITKGGHKLTFDIIGLGVNATFRDDTPFNPGQTYAKVATLGNTLGLQLTMTNGFYFAWRNTFSGYNWRSHEGWREVTTISDAGEFKTMLFFGYDFGALAKKRKAQ
ncbi:MAG: hypothetical protein ACRCY4_05800 [Brevinema sp.]